jgi:hypothetical protein
MFEFVDEIDQVVKWHANVSTCTNITNQKMTVNTEMRVTANFIWYVINATFYTALGAVWAMVNE